MKINGFELVNFTDLTYDQKMMVLTWRNHPETRKWMYTQEVIDENHHLAFLESLKMNHEKLYFLIKNDQHFFGVIDFYNFKDSECEFGLYSNPFDKTAGIGRILESIAINYAFEILKVSKLKLEVFKDNTQVINLHKKYHFVEKYTKTIDNKLVLGMELINENQ